MGSRTVASGALLIVVVVAVLTLLSDRPPSPVPRQRVVREQARCGPVGSGPCWCCCRHRTKASGGDGPPLQLDTLSHPELTPTRRKLVDELVGLAGDVTAGRAALNLSERQVGELKRNAALWTAPTLPALHRYTGVLVCGAGRGLVATPQQSAQGPAGSVTRVGAV